MEVWILPGDLEGLIPHQTVDSELRCPVKLDEMTLSFSVNEGERVDAEPLHHPKRPWDPSVAHGPENGVGGLRLKGEEVPEVVVCGLAGRYLVVRLRLDGVNKVGELHGILDEEHRNVVSVREARKSLVE